MKTGPGRRNNTWKVGVLRYGDHGMLNVAGIESITGAEAK